MNYSINHISERLTELSDKADNRQELSVQEAYELSLLMAFRKNYDDLEDHINLVKALNAVGQLVLANILEIHKSVKTYNQK